ncbi:MAG: branched-chain amino acid transport system substrate-binding protein [Desulfovibrionales bacterium]|jgi:branched-chain amino acid transport system substrate-binding protein|nr:branched-chain amino acid transport system substrate-binding protein [Desulfovibrionales bacterium]
MLQRRWIYTGLLVLVLFAGCSGGDQKPSGELTVGLIAVMSGELFRYGQDAVEAARFAAKEANDQGGVPLGPASDAPRLKVRLLTEDSRHDPQTAADAAAKLIEKDGAAAIIGPVFSTLAEDVASVAQRLRTPMITPFATVSSLTHGKKYVFRIPDNNNVQGQALAWYAFNELKISTAAVLFDASDVYAREFDQVFTKDFTAFGGKITANAPYGKAERNFGALLRDIVAGAPDTVFLPNAYKEVMIQVRELRKLGFKKVVIGPDSWKGRELFGAREFRNTVFIDHWLPDMPTPGNKAFVAAYEKMYNHPPTEMAALTYDAFGALFAAVRRAGDANPQKIAQALVDMPPYQGVTGLVEFNVTGDPVTEIFMVRIDPNGETSITRFCPTELQQKADPSSDQ